MNFKYTLDKSSKKFLCPNCHKKTFVRFVVTETGSYLKYEFGRCDRESKCQYHYAPLKGKKCYLITFLSLRTVSDKALQATEGNCQLQIIPKSQILERKSNSCWITEWWLKANNIAYLSCESRYFSPDEEGIDAVATGATAFTVAAVATAHIKPKKSFHSLKLLDKMYNKQPVEDNLQAYLKSIFSKDQVFTAMQNYLLTATNHSWPNSTVFWQVDHEEKIHAGKIMLYEPATGKRVKKPYNHITWVHKALKKQDFNLNQCLYGLHRIKEDYTAPIAIVESEKTAIIMSIILPKVLWLAAGSKQNIKAALLEPLTGRKVILYPDKGEYEDWKKKGEVIRKLGFTIEVSDILEASLLEPGSDLVDYYLSSMEEDAGNAKNAAFK